MGSFCQKTARIRIPCISALASLLANIAFTLKNLKESFVAPYTPYTDYTTPFIQI